MISHLDHCEPCRHEVAVLAEFAAAQHPAERATRSAWWLAAAASLVTVVGIGLWRQGRTEDQRLPVASLVAAAAPLGYRPVQARLSGDFGWAEYHGPARSSTESQDPKLLKLKGAAGDVLQEAEASPTPDRKHAAAIAMLLLENPRGAIEALTKVTAERPNDARAWSDLAAAYDAAAMYYGRPKEELPAIAAADRAIRLDPKLAEAHFNRAVILEHMGITPEAREAWTKYLELDPSSDWAREARARLDALPKTTEQSRFDAARPQLERDAASGNVAATRAAVDRFPQRSREMVERETLGQWSDAFRAGDDARAARALAIARTIGEALRGRGEELPAAMASAIANASPAERARLAAATAAYCEGRQALLPPQSAPKQARQKMLEAASLFGNTPGALSARHFAAVGSDRLNDPETAERELTAVLAITPGGYRAQRAQIEWVLGRIQGGLAHWRDALVHYKRSADLFTGQGEQEYAAYLQWLTAEAGSFLGRYDEAWQTWAAVMPVLSEQRRFPACLNGMAYVELVAGNVDAARSLAEIALRHGARDGQTRAEVLFRLARMRERMGEHTAAIAAITEGQRVTARITDRDVRRQTTADLLYAEGVTYATANPYRALDSLTRAAEEHRGGWRPMLLPATLYERARILRTLSRDDEARTDLESAIAAVESQRKPVEWRATTSGALDGVDLIYAELAELLLERGRPREAFAIIDRAAAFAFFGADATASMTTLDALQQQLASDSLIVEYLVRPRRTYAFVIGARTFEVRTIDIASADVARLAATLDETLRLPKPLPEVIRASAAMEKTLLGPVRELLLGANDLTFILDPLIASVPMAVLVDPSSERWLVEDHSIRIAASALYRDPAAHEASSRVVVIRPSGGVSLPGTEAEVATIQRLHPKATLLQGDATTVAAVLAAMRDAGVIHYMGHAGGEGDAGLVLRADGDKPELLRGDDITGTPLRAAPLVVLAGCRTLRGAARREDLATSLARAFLIAGASSVVGTSWDVNDTAAQIFFSRFHELNSATGNPVTALRDAQRFMLHDPRRHPAEWAFAQIVVRSINL